MSLACLILWAATGGDTLALKESVRLEDGYVRLLDVVDAAALGGAVRAELAGIYLGRVPGSGRARTITSSEISRQLGFRGLDPARFRFSRDGVLVRGPGGGAAAAKAEGGSAPASPANPRADRAGAAVRSRSVVRAVSPSYEVDARALQEGAPGDEILLEFVSTRNRVRGRVIDAGRVEVVEGVR